MPGGGLVGPELRWHFHGHPGRDRLLFHQLSSDLLHLLNLAWELKWIVAVLITALYLRGNTTSVFFPSPDFWKLGLWLINPQIPSSIRTNSKVTHNKWIRVNQWIGYVIFWWVCWIVGWLVPTQTTKCIGLNSPPTNWMPPATRPMVREMRSEMQQPIKAVSATKRRRPHPTPVTTVQILHSRLGML